MTDVLHISDMCLKAGCPPINQRIKKQRILGLAGLEGHGQSAFLQALAGVYSPLTGTVTTGTGKTINSLFDAVREKVIYMPSDRKKNGIFPQLSVQDNFMLGNLKRFSTWGWLQKSHANTAVDGYRQELSISYAHRHIPISHLSGGNQQKVLLARAMAQNPQVMLLNDPTRGVDIHTRRSLYTYFRTAVKQKALTLVILSTELDEILQLCDRVLVFRDYHIFTELDTDNMCMESLMSAMFGQHP